MNKKNRYIAVLSSAAMVASILGTAVPAKAATGDVYNLSTKQVVSRQSDGASDRLKFALSMFGHQNEFGYELNQKVYSYKVANDAVTKLPAADRVNGVKVLAEIEKTTPVGPTTDFNQGLNVQSVSAINATQVELTFNKEVKADTVVPKNFKVTDKDANPLFVSKAEVKATDAKVVVLSFFDAFVDKATYIIATTNVADKDGKVMVADSDVFAFAKADVAKVEFTKTTVAPGTDLKKLVKVTDKLGRDVTAEQVINLKFTSSDTKVVTNDGVAGTKSDADNKSAVVTVTLGDTGVTAKAVINVKDVTATTFVGYLVDANPTTIAADSDAFAKLTSDKVITYAVKGASGTQKLALYVKDQYGNKMDGQLAFTSVTNLTPNVVIVNAADGVITPVSAGTGYIKVTVGDLEKTVQIDVRELGAVKSFTVEKTSVDLIDKGADAEVALNFVDQYGTKMDATKVALSEVKAADPTVINAGVTAGKLTIKPLKEGSTKITLTYKGKDEADKDITLTQTVDVKVTKAGTLTDYTAESDKVNLDVFDDLTTSDVHENVATVKVYPLDSNGSKLVALPATGAVDVQQAKVVLLDKDGKETDSTDKAIVEVNDTNDKITAKGVGTATVRVKVGSYTVKDITFTVANTTPGTPAKVEFTNNALVNVKVGTNLQDLLKGILSVKDVAGIEILNNDATTKNTVKSYKFTYIVTNNDANVTVASEKVAIADLTKQNTADIVVTGVELYDGSNVLLKNVKNLSEVIKLSVDVAEAKIEAATAAVIKAEGSKLQADVDAAKTLVTALSDGTVKTDLNGRLVVVQKGIADAKTQEETATAAVVKAEGSKLQADVDAAKTLVTALTNGTVKTDLNGRLVGVQKGIDDTANQAAVDGKISSVKASYELVKGTADSDAAKTTAVKAAVVVDIADNTIIVDVVTDTTNVGKFKVTLTKNGKTAVKDAITVTIAI